MSIFYRPTDGIVGDVIPFYWDGVFHAFYLKAPLPPKRQGADFTSYAHVASRDLAHWEEWPLVISPGAPGEPDDLSCFTGSIIERNGTFHLFYTGYRGPDKPQTICRAVSHDLRYWEKDPANPILAADPRWYEPNDWRDPFPFWNEEAGEYWMIMAARGKTGPSNRRGCVALAVSPDLEHWEVRPPFWFPRLYFTHECPDLFRWNGKWVLVYSTFSERMVTHYRVSDSLSGPWLAPTNDTFDGRAFYAAKTASNGRRRFVFGWLPTRQSEMDKGPWEWGGSMVIHELKANGTDGLAVVIPPQVERLFANPQSLAFQPCLGDWKTEEPSLIASANDGFAICLLGEPPDPCEIRCEVLCSQGTRSCGMLLRTDPQLESYYQLRWEPGRNRVVFDRWPRPGDEPFVVERPFEARLDKPVKLRIVIDGTAVVAYIDDVVALSCRAYDHRTGQLGLFVSEGSAIFSNMALRTV